jgi:hypothetical protein
MAGFFQSIYDWLLRLFWYISSFLSVSSCLAWMIRICADSNVVQGDGDGCDHDRSSECWKDVVVESPSCKSSIMFSGDSLG